MACSVDQCLSPVLQDLLNKGRRPSDEGPRQQISLREVAASRALAAHCDAPVCQHRIAQVVQWGSMWKRELLGSAGDRQPDRKSTRLNSSHLGISYAVFC